MTDTIMARPGMARPGAGQAGGVLSSIALTLGLLIAVPIGLYQWLLKDSMPDPGLMWCTLFGCEAREVQASELDRALTLPDGLHASVFADDIANVRFLGVLPNQEVIASVPRQGQLLLLRADIDGDGYSDGRRVLLSGLNAPHGFLWQDGWLYVAETDALSRFRLDMESMEITSEREVVLGDLPGGGNHWAKNVLAGENGWLYLMLGSSCNVCEEDDPRRASIMRLKPDGSEAAIYASGLRNSEAMAWVPWSGELIAADIARDMLGDDFPPDELNVIEQGGFYGWPYINGFGVADPDLGDRMPSELKPAIDPVYGFRAHVSPLDIHFPEHEYWQKRWPRSALVTLHGSWNRSVPDGYSVIRLHWDEQGNITESPFITGFLQPDGSKLGRPVDLVELNNGDLLLSDDYSGAIYRISTTVYQLANEEQRVEETSNDTVALSLSAEQRSEAEAMWRQYGCAGCHAAPGKLNGGLPLVGLTERYTQESLANFFVTPTPPMPVFPLSAAEREVLAAWLLVASGSGG